MKLTEAGLEFRKRGIFFHSARDEKLLKCSLSNYLRNKWKITDWTESFIDQIKPKFFFFFFFFNRGMTIAVVQFSGTWPLIRKRLIISMIEGANTSRQDFTIHVGTGSNRQEAILQTSTGIAERLSRVTSRDCWTWNLSRFSYIWFHFFLFEEEGAKFVS